jgi:hypothetical protein
MEPRETIVKVFAKWAAVSASRRGDVRKGEELYPLLEDCYFDELFNDNISISEDEFKNWHRKITKKMTDTTKNLSIGWAAKLINVYLKTRVYIAGEGRPNLKECIHPPIDGILWKKIKETYRDDPSISDKLDIFTTINAISDYEEDYEPIIDVFRIITNKRHISLIEVDELWDPEGKKYEQ